ncbi:class I SAM-dependent methyltransferase [Aspergillus undulatus]|uniref:class I SAM-dependent methyltransferase n=1 Tax=Aspergillus undulatus TaxID=1810928 RepID=UPI003CCD1FF1
MATSTPAPQPGTAAAAFDKASEVYERLTGGCTRELAAYLLTLEPRVSPSSIILDNACGTGILTSEILSEGQSSHEAKHKPKPRIFAADLAPSMVSNFMARAQENGWLGGDGEDGDDKLSISVMDAGALTYPDDTFTHSYTNLGFPFFPDGEKAAAHMYRTLKPGGTAFITTWKGLGYLPHIQRAQLAVRPDSVPWETPMPKEWYTKGKLEGVLKAGGFKEDKIQVQTKKVGYRGTDVEDLVDIMKQGFLGQVTSGWSEEEKEHWVKELKGGLSSEEKTTACVEMVAWVAIAHK